MSPLSILRSFISHPIALHFGKKTSRNRTHAQIFGEIYSRHLWGGERGRQLDYCSGLGSFPENASSYEEFVTEFVRERALNSIVDIGCGDFQVSRRILSATGRSIRYIGLDVVPDLIERNNLLFGTECISFAVADAVSDPLPPGDLLLVREVLQHLSNQSIRVVLEKAKAYPFALITNGVAYKPVRKNLDIVPGASTRASLRSGLWLELPPFNFPCSVAQSVPHASGGANFRTVLYCRESVPATTSV